MQQISYDSQIVDAQSLIESMFSPKFQKKYDCSDDELDQYNHQIRQEEIRRQKFKHKDSFHERLFGISEKVLKKKGTLMTPIQIDTGNIGMKGQQRPLEGDQDENQKQTEQEAQQRGKRKTPITMEMVNRAKQLFEKRKIDSEITMKKIAKQLGISHSSVGSLYSQWKFDPQLSRRVNIILNGRRFWMERRVQYLRLLLADNPFLTQEEMVYLLNKNSSLIKNGKALTKFTVHDLLRQLNYFKIVTDLPPKHKQTLEEFQHKKALSKKVANCWKNKQEEVFFFKIEMINMYTVRGKGWGPAGQTLNTQAPVSKKNNLLVILLGSQQCKLRAAYQTPESGKKQILRSIATMIKEEGIVGGKKQPVVLVNRKFMLSNQILEMFQRFNIKVVLVPENIIELNPLDSLMREVKNELRSFNFQHMQQFQEEIVRQIQAPHSKTFSKNIEYLHFYLMNF